MGGQSNSWRSIYHHCDPWSIHLLECISRGISVHLASDLNAKHKDWNSRLNFPRGVLLKEFASKNSCSVHGPDSPTTIPSCPTVTPNVLDIVVVKDIVLPMNLAVCSAHSSDHFPVTVDLRARSSCNLFPSPHEGWNSEGGSNLSCTLQFICERHSSAFPPHRTGPVC